MTKIMGFVLRWGRPWRSPRGRREWPAQNDAAMNRQVQSFEMPSDLWPGSQIAFPIRDLMLALGYLAGGL